MIDPYDFELRRLARNDDPEGGADDGGGDDGESGRESDGPGE
jgi:hypothetical protein